MRLSPRDAAGTVLSANIWSSIDEPIVTSVIVQPNSEVVPSGSLMPVRLHPGAVAWYVGEPAPVQFALRPAGSWSRRFPVDSWHSQIDVGGLTTCP
jgi:hypothetical protein